MAERDYRVKYTAVANFGKFLQSLKNVEKRLDALNDKTVKGTKKATDAQEDQTDAVKETTAARQKDSKVAKRTASAVSSAEAKAAAAKKRSDKEALAAQKRLGKETFQWIQRLNRAKIAADKENAARQTRSYRDELSRQKSLGGETFRQINRISKAWNAAYKEKEVRESRAYKESLSKQEKLGKETLQQISRINKAWDAAYKENAVRETRAHKNIKDNLDEQLVGYKRLADVFNKQISGKDSSALGRIDGGSGDLITEVKKAESGLETFMQTLDAVRGKLSPTQVNAYRDSMHNLSLEFGSNAKNFASHAHELASNAAAMAESNRQADEASKKGTRVQRTYSKLTGIMKAVGGSFYQVKAAFLGLGIATVAFSLQSIVSLLAAAGGAAVVFANALAQLGGVIATVPGGILAVAAAAGGVALAFRGVGKAFSLFAKENGPPVPATYAEALAQMSPAARKVTSALTALYPQWQKLQKAAQQSFFGPLVPQISNFKTILGSLRPLLVSAAGAVGKVAAKGVEMMASGPWQESFSRLSESNVKVIGSLGDALLSVMDAFRLIADAARPLTEFVGQTIAGLADDFRNWSSSLNENSFDTVGTRLTQFISIIKSFGSIISSVFKAAGDTTDWLMQRFDAVAKGWATTVKGASQEGGKLNKFFDGLQPVLSEVGKLFGDVFRGLAGMVDLGALTTSIGVIRTKLLPAVFELMNVLGQPENMDKFIDAIASIASIFAKVIDSGILTFITTLITVFDALATVLNTLAGIPIIGQFVKIAGGIAGAAAAGVVLIGIYDKIAGRIKRLGAVATAAGTKLGLLNAAETAGSLSVSRTTTKQKPSAPVIVPGGAARGAGAAAKGASKAGAAAKAATSAFSRLGAVATRALSAVGSFGSSFVGFLGGPLGAIATAVTGFAFLSQHMSHASKQAAIGAKTTEEWAKSLREVSENRKLLDGAGASESAMAAGLAGAEKNVGTSGAGGFFGKLLGMDSSDELNKAQDQVTKFQENVRRAFFETGEEAEQSQKKFDTLFTGLAQSAKKGEFQEFANGLNQVIDAAKKQPNFSFDALAEKLPATVAMLDRYAVSLKQFNEDPTSRARFGFNTLFDTLAANKDRFVAIKQNAKSLDDQLKTLTVSQKNSTAALVTEKMVAGVSVEMLTKRGQKINETRLAIDAERQALLASGVEQGKVNQVYTNRINTLLQSIPLTQKNATMIEQMNAAIGNTVAVVTASNGKSVKIPVNVLGQPQAIDQLVGLEVATRNADGTVTVKANALTDNAEQRLVDLGVATRNADGTVTINVDKLNSDPVQQQLVDIQKQAQGVSSEPAHVDVQAENASNVRNALLEVADAQGRIERSIDIAVTTTKKTETVGPNKGGRIGSTSIPTHRFARGGGVPGVGDEDTVPAMLTPGEYVLPKKVVKAIGTSRLDKLRSAGSRAGQVIQYFAGGSPGGVKKKRAASLNANQREALAGANAGKDLGYKAGYLKAYNEAAAQFKLSKSSEKTQALARVKEAAKEAAANRNRLLSSRQLERDEIALARAHRDQRQAVLDAAKANRDATRAYEDAETAYNNRGLTADTIQSNYDQAKQTYQRTMADSGSTAADRRAADVAWRQAQLDRSNAERQLGRDNADFLDYVKPSEQNRQQSIAEGVDPANDALNDFTYTILDLNAALRETQKAINPTVATPAKGKVAAGKKKRATGGTVDALREYLVGERGEELFIPAERGRVVTAAQTARILGGGISSPFDFGNLVPSVPSLSVPSTPSASVLSGSSNSSSINNSKNVSVGSMTINNPYRERSTDSIQRQLKKMTSREY